MTSPHVPITTVKLDSTQGPVSNNSAAPIVNNTAQSKLPLQSAIATPVTGPILVSTTTSSSSTPSPVPTTAVSQLQPQHTLFQQPSSNVANPTATLLRHPGAPVQQQQQPIIQPLTITSPKKKKAIVTMAVAQTATPASTQGENTGRWTAEEHRLFLQGLEAHGKGWKKIASLIKSRTVVQIRTHAQKYFQKLAKARQNGEEGDVSMENRERASISPATKRRRSGTKRKAIQSVVASAEREGKRRASAAKSKKNTEGKTSPPAIPLLPTVAPALAPFVYPQQSNSLSGQNKGASFGLSSIPFGSISIPALEDSLFRFLTPAPNLSDSTTQVNDIARQAGANAITLPSTLSLDKTSAHFSSQVGGDVSPTGVADFSTSWTWNASELPEWYTKGSDVDELLDEAEVLDWLADSGDLNEVYTPPPEDAIEDHDTFHHTPNQPHVSQMSEPSLLNLTAENGINVKTEDNNNTVQIPVTNQGNSLKVISSASLHMPTLPSFFESSSDLTTMKKSTTKLSMNNLYSSATEAADAASHDLLFDEQAFVTALLDQDSTNNLLNH